MASATDGRTAGKGRLITECLLILLSAAAAGGWLWYSKFIQLDMPDIGTSIAMFYLVVFGPIMAIGILCGLITGKPVLRAGPRPLLWLVLGMLAGTAAIGATVGLAWLAGAVQPAPPGGMPAMPLVSLGFGLALFGVIAEEAMFRGWLQPVLVEWIGVPGGVVAGAITFAAFHAIIATWDPVSLVNMFLGGLLFGLLALRSGGLLAPIAAHFAYNAIEDNGLGLVPDGLGGALGSVFDLGLAGTPVWGGGPDGLNASIGTSAILVALCLPLLLRAGSMSVAVPVQPRTA